MKGLLELGTLAVVLVIGFVVFERYSAQAAAANNAQAIAAANRSNAWTQLGFNAGTGALNTILNNLPLPQGGN